MLAVIQRVSSSSVRIEGRVAGGIGKGLNVLLGVVKDDTQSDIDKLLGKIVNLRIFPDKKGKMNLSLIDVSGSMLVISQFTLPANVKRGRRPSFDESADPKIANDLYEKFIELAKELVLDVQSGEFGAKMDVSIQNDGPVTFILDSKEL